MTCACGFGRCSGARSRSANKSVRSGTKRQRPVNFTGRWLFLFFALLFYRDRSRWVMWSRAAHAFLFQRADTVADLV